MTDLNREQVREALVKTGIAEFMVQEDTLPIHVQTVRAAARAWLDLEGAIIIKRDKMAAASIVDVIHNWPTGLNDFATRQMANEIIDALSVEGDQL